MKRYKSKDYAEGEKLSYKGKKGCQLSCHLPKWMKDKIREKSQESEMSISRYVINLLKKEWRQ